jgi:hypothetical protein
MRIRKTLERVAQGDCSVTLRLRDSDDPVMKDLVNTIGQLCERSRHSHQFIQDAARDLSAALAALQDGMAKGLPALEIQKQMESIRQKQATLEKAVQSLGS